MIEEALYSHLQSQDVLSPFLASYGGNKAIFNQEAPADTDAGWDSDLQYGRIVFAIDTQTDPERGVSATLMVDISCKNGEQVPEEIEPLVRTAIDGYFFSQGMTTMAAQWQSSNYFTEPTEKVNGVTMTFTLLAFPKQTTIEPDPIALINEWTSEELTQILGVGIRVIGRDELPDAWKPTNEFPAIYWRIQQTQKCTWIPDTYQCSWLTAVLQGHVLTPDKDIADIICRLIHNTLTVKKRLIFADNSPLMVDRNIRHTPTADELRTGQISIEGTYGILTPPLNSNLLQHLNVNGREVQK